MEYNADRFLPWLRIHLLFNLLDFCILSKKEKIGGNRETLGMCISKLYLDVLHFVFLDCNCILCGFTWHFELNQMLSIMCVFLFLSLMVSFQLCYFCSCFWWFPSFSSVHVMFSLINLGILPHHLVLTLKKPLLK
jgi:hypothetical protein